MPKRQDVFVIGDRVRLNDDSPSPTDPVGIVIDVVLDPETVPRVTVRWPTGTERSYHPTGLAGVDPG